MAGMKNTPITTQNRQKSNAKHFLFNFNMLNVVFMVDERMYFVIITINAQHNNIREMHLVQETLDIHVCVIVLYCIA